MAYARKEPLTLDNTTIAVGSITFAVKARRLLTRGGIKAKLIKVAPSETAGGCSYGIVIASARFFDAVVILKENGVPYSVYREGAP